MSAKVKLGFTVIQHAPRVAYGLSMNQYSLAAALYHLSNNPDAPVRGWCSASKKTLAQFFGISTKTVFNLLDELQAAGWIERKDEDRPGANGLVRTTPAWYRKIENWDGTPDLSGLTLKVRGMKNLHTPPADVEGMKNLHTPPMQDLHTPYVNLAHNSNTSTDKGDTTFFLEADGGPISASQPERPGGPGEAPPVAATPPEVAGPPQDGPGVAELYDEMAAFWNVSSTRWVQNYAKLRAFVRQHAAGQIMLGAEPTSLEFIRDQFQAYRASRGKLEKHTLDNWVGSQADDWNGAWRRENWVGFLTDQQAREATRQPSVFAKHGGKGSHLSNRRAAASAAQAMLADDDEPDQYVYTSPAASDE